MDLRFTTQQDAFRQEVRSFIEAYLPADVARRIRLGQHPSKQQTIDWQRALNRRGWAAPHWPQAYGGCDMGIVEKLILQEELFRACAPQPLAFNVTMIGPVILRFGTEAQKSHYLPKLANLDLWFCQGFSEPGSGSDLASLRTSALRDGDEYVVNGQKIWTTLAQHADWIFCLVRTSPGGKKQEGISMLLIDMSSPGVTVRPIRSIDGAHHLNEVFFDNVRVPIGNLVGSEGQGWECTKFLLTNERTMIAKVGHCYERLAYARQLAEAQSMSAALSQRIREELALLEAEVRGLEMIQWRLVSAGDAASGATASVLKLRGSELQQRISALLLRLAGPRALEVACSASDPADEWAAAAGAYYLYARAITIYGGATEIQKEILSRECF